MRVRRCISRHSAFIIPDASARERIDALGADGAACANCVKDLLISRRAKMAHEASIDGLVTRPRWNPDSFYIAAHVLLPAQEVPRCTEMVALAHPRITIVSRQKPLKL